MGNYLQMAKAQQLLALLELDWSCRRIEAETGVRRETVSRYDAACRAKAAKVFSGSDASLSDALEGGASDAVANAAKVFAGSRRPRESAASYRTAITEKLDAGLSAQRIWQDLVEEFGYGASYESVKRFVRTLAPRPRAVGVFHHAPGAAGQVDVFRGAPTLHAATGEWRRPWVFRMTLGHSRHGYEEAVDDQQLETFLRLHEHAFRDFGGVPLVIRRPGGHGDPGSLPGTRHDHPDGRQELSTPIPEQCRRQYISVRSSTELSQRLRITAAAIHTHAPYHVAAFEVFLSGRI